MNFYLPSKIPSYLLRLSSYYKSTPEMVQLQMILSSARVFISEGSTIENGYNEDMSGHDIRLFLPMEVLEKIDIKEQDGLINTLIDDVKRVAARTPGEFINSINLEMNDENDPEFQSARLIGNKPLIQADSLKIWKPGFVRVFISHRDQQKIEAQKYFCNSPNM